MSITGLPDNVGNLVNVETINMSKNNLETVPASIGKLQKLKKLNFSGNPIKTLPIELGNCKSLKSLNLKGCGTPQEEVDKITKMLPKLKVKV